MSKTFLMAAAMSIALAGCGGSGPDDAAGDTLATGTPSPVANASATPPVTPAAAQAEAEVLPPPPPPVPPPLPALPAAPPSAQASPSSPPALTPQASKGEKGARAVLLTWARALENGDYDLAWEQFRHPPAGRNGYAKWWRRYRTITVAVGDGTVEGAAGSLYYEVPATLTGETVGGEPYRLTGTVILRRVNDVDGATPEQLAWHIDTADLKDAADQ